MKYVKRFNESWITDIFKEKTIGEVLADKTEKIFSKILQNEVLISDISCTAIKNGCLIEITKLYDTESNDGYTYIFEVSIDNNYIFLKRINKETKYPMFSDLKLTYMGEYYLENNLVMFAKKIKSFLNSNLE